MGGVQIYKRSEAMLARLLRHTCVYRFDTFFSCVRLPFLVFLRPLDLVSSHPSPLSSFFFLAAGVGSAS